MKKKFMSLLLIPAVFGMASCDFQWPTFITNIFPGLAKNKEEKSSDGTNPGGETPSGQDPGEGGDPSGGGDPTETTSEVSFTLTSASSVTKSGVTVTFAKGNGNNDPAWYDAGLRLYAKNTLSFTSETDIKTIEFDWEKQGSKAFATLTANTGSYSHPSAAGKGTWTGSSKSIVFTLGDATAQLQLNTFKVTIVGSGGGGSGGGSTEAEFPSSIINTYTEGLGSSIHLPEFSGTALSYDFDSDYGTLDIEVGTGNEATAIATFQSDLLGSNNFVQGAADQYGDMHYISTDNILDVCAWDGNDASTAAPGHIYVDIIEYVEPSTTLPTTQVNTFLTSNSFGFTISSSVESSLNALSNSFTVNESTYNGYPIMLIEMSGDVASSVDAALSPTLLGASYEAYTGDDLDEGEYYYTNETSYTSVYIYAQNGITTIQLY